MLVAGAAAALLVLLEPSTEFGGDGTVYDAMARHPFDTAHQLGPFPFRVLVPLLVWILPGTHFAFHLLSFLGLMVGGVVTAVLARDLGVAPRLALLAPAVYVLSFAGVYGTWQFEMIDTEGGALTSAALLCAWRGRKLAFVLVGMLAASAREYGATVPLGWWAANRASGRERRAIVEAVALGVPILLTYALIQLLVPHPPGGRFTFRNTSYAYFEQFGLLRFLARSLVQSFGVLFVLWPIGAFLGGPRWRSFQLYAIGVLPFLSVTDWNRMGIYLLPFCIPSALLVLMRGPYAAAVVALAGSACLATLLSFHNLPNEAGYPAHAPELVAAGAVAAVAAAWSLVRGRTAGTPAEAPPRRTDPAPD